MVVRTRIVLGSRETPRFVPKDFFDALQGLTHLYQYEQRLYPTTIAYKIPTHMVVERRHSNMDQYEIHLNDSLGVPECHRYKNINRQVFKRRRPGPSFDRFRWITEEHYRSYFLLVPNAMYYNAEVYTEWSCSWVVYNNITWYIHFRKVFVDPHDASSTVWFHGSPKYSVELITLQDFRGREEDLKRAVLAILPRAFRWE